LRELISLEIETSGGKKVTEKKNWNYFELSDYKYLTYKELEEKVRFAGSALREVGVEKGKMFNIFASTSKEWQIMANGKLLTSIRDVRRRGDEQENKEKLTPRFSDFCDPRFFSLCFTIHHFRYSIRFTRRRRTPTFNHRTRSLRTLYERFSSLDRRSHRFLDSIPQSSHLRWR